MQFTTRQVSQILGDHWWGYYMTYSFNKPYMARLLGMLAQERTRYNIFPAREDVFKAFALSPFMETKVIIVGQDPYHTPKAAHGLAFSTLSDNIPPSLKNIYKEIERDFDFSLNTSLSGDLTYLAEQGVLLLNRVLTVRQGQANSHQAIGWEEFTLDVIRELSDDYLRPKVFMLWGNAALQLKPYIHPTHLVLTASHPSPYSYELSFKGCGHFKICNEFLRQHEYKQISWNNDSTTRT